MAIYTWPAGRAWRPRSLYWGSRALVRSNTSALNGAAQAITLPGSRWLITMSFPAQRSAERAELMGLLVKVGGGEHLLQISDLGQPRPRGTINLTGVTASAAAQFAITITLNGCGNARTLLAGDKFAVGGQLLMCTDTATSSAGGVMVVSFRHMLRAAVAGGAAVTLDAPAALFQLLTPEIGSQADPADRSAPMSFDLVEAFA
jgi:hypothetical protein